MTNEYGEGRTIGMLVDRPENYQHFEVADEPKSREVARERLRCESCGGIVEVIRRGEGQPMCCDLPMEYESG